jgi:hypothetical protein
LFPKSASGGGGAKRGFDDMSKETAQMSEAMNRLSVANAPPASKPAPKGKGEPALKDDDEEEEGDEEEEEGRFAHAGPPTHVPPADRRRRR